MGMGTKTLEWKTNHRIAYGNQQALTTVSVVALTFNVLRSVNSSNS